MVTLLQSARVDNVTGGKGSVVHTAVGSDVDIHTPHWHGNTVLANGRRYDEVDRIPNVINADMHAGNPGTWLFHCHVNDHIKGEMSSLTRQGLGQ